MGLKARVQGPRTGGNVWLIWGYPLFNLNRVPRAIKCKALKIFVLSCSFHLVYRFSIASSRKVIANIASLSSLFQKLEAFSEITGYPLIENNMP
jgi:hypothetical protein